MTAKNNIGVAMAGGNGDYEPNGHYPTPHLATEALVQAFMKRLPRRVWEPACGGGHMAEVLKAWDLDVLATDLYDYGYGIPQWDFLTGAVPRGVKAIITNPPFMLAEAFIRRADELRVPFFAFLLKANYFNVAGRIGLFKEIPPSHVMPLTWRLDFTGKGAPTMDCSWYVWDPEARGTVFKPLKKPWISMGPPAL